MSASNSSNSFQDFFFYAKVIIKVSLRTKDYTIYWVKREIKNERELEWVNYVNLLKKEYFHPRILSHSSNSFKVLWVLSPLVRRREWIEIKIKWNSWENYFSISRARSSFLLLIINSIQRVHDERWVSWGEFYCLSLFILQASFHLVSLGLETFLSKYLFRTKKSLNFDLYWRTDWTKKCRYFSFVGI